jgi:hypothetical protein
MNVSDDMKFEIINYASKEGFRVLATFKLLNILVNLKVCIEKVTWKTHNCCIISAQIWFLFEMCHSLPSTTKESKQ